MRTIAAIAIAVLVCACGGDVTPPAALQAGTTCGYCRMTVLDARLASQVVAAGEEPIFFDDLHCLVSYLRARDRSRQPGRVYVADHLTGTWVPADKAVYGRDPSRATPMGSHLVAYKDETSRAADHLVGPEGALSVRDVFGVGEGETLVR